MDIALGHNFSVLLYFLCVCVRTFFVYRKRLIRLYRHKQRLFHFESCMQQHHKLSFTMTAKFLYHLQCLLLLVFVLVLTVTILTGSNLLKRISFVPNFVEFQPVNLNKAAQCYRSPDHSNSINYFVDVLDAKIQPKIGQTIFFHETTCSETGIVHLNAK